MDIDREFVIGVISLIALVSIYPLTAITFFKARLPKKNREYKRMLRKLGYTEKSGPAYVPTLENEYKWTDYILPVFFASLIAFLCAFVMIMGPKELGYGKKIPGMQPTTAAQASEGASTSPQSGEVRSDSTASANKPYISLLLNGPSIAKNSDIPSIDRDKLFAMLVISLAFAGSYIWSIQCLYRRLATLDLVPAAYYSIGIRIIFSIFVALLVYYSFTSGNIDSIAKKNNVVDSPAAIAIYAFLAGMFPQRWLKWIQDKFDLTKNKDNSSPLPLSMIEGVGLFERNRFVELGIDNAQNLAKSNFVEIIVRTPFNPREVIDWIGQARLYLYFKDDITKLRDKAGIRTIFNLKKAGKEDGLKTIAELSGVSIKKLTTVYTLIKDDKDIDVLTKATEKLIEGEESLPASATINDS